MTIEKKAAVAVDPWESPKETWQYVAVPDEDPTGQPFPTITLNKITFQKGQTYQLPIPVATYVKERIKVFNQSVVRLFSGRADQKSLNEVSVGTTAPTAPSGDRPGYVDAASIRTL